MAGRQATRFHAHMKYRLGLAASADSRIRAVSSSLCFSVEALIGKSITTPSTGCGTIARAQSSVLKTSVNLADYRQSRRSFVKLYSFIPLLDGFVHFYPVQGMSAGV